jgi:predicted nucleic acid-binding protein
MPCWPAALSGNADVIVTGDAQLLSLHTDQGVRILSPRRFLEWIDRQA